MRLRALILLAAVVLLSGLAASIPSQSTLQKHGFYMVSAEGNTVTLYGTECNAIISEKTGVVRVHHALFDVISRTKGFPDITCDKNTVLISNAVETNVLSAACIPDQNALPKVVRCGDLKGCRIASAEPFEKNGWYIHLLTWGYPSQICVNGSCVQYGGTADVNIPAQAGENNVMIVCGKQWSSVTVVTPAAAPPEKNTGVIEKEETNAPGMQVLKEGNAELNTVLTGIKKQARKAEKIWVDLGTVRVRAPSDVNAFLEKGALVLKNSGKEGVTVQIKPAEKHVKYYAIAGRGKIVKIPGKVRVPGKGKVVLHILSNTPHVKIQGHRYLIEVGKKAIAVEVNADSFQVAPTDVPGAPGKILAMFSFEKNVPAGSTVSVRISVPGSNVRLWKYDGKTWRPITFAYRNGWATYTVKDNGPLDQDPTPGRIVDDVAVGTNGLTIDANLLPQIVPAGDRVTIIGHVEKNGTAVANNWINIYLDGNRLGGPIEMNGPSDWWNKNWKYRREIDISNDTGTTLTGFQVLVKMDLNALYEEGKLRRDAGDLRFVTPDGNVLPYWIESVLTPATPIPQASDDENVLTKDTECETNPVYRYYEVVDTDGSGSSEAPPGWYTADFNDADWNIGTAPFGNTGGQCTTALQAQPMDLFLRKWFKIYGEPKDGVLHIAVGGGVRCYVNGYLVIDELNVATSATYWNYSVELNDQVLQEGDNLLACWVALGGENNGDVNAYFDAEVDVNYYERILPDANIWVRVPSIPPGGTKIYVYYGNPSAAKVESYDDTFDIYNLGKTCQGSTAGGYCTVTFDPSTDLDDNYVFFRDQRYGHGTMNMLMSGDFADNDYYGPEYATVYYQNNNTTWTQVGNYYSGQDGCVDLEAKPYPGSNSPPWPMDISSWIAGQTQLDMAGAVTYYVNTDPDNCGYYYHFVWYIDAALRKTASPEPTATLGPEMMDTQTDAQGDFNWTFTAPDSVGIHYVRVDVNDGNDFASLTVPLYVVGNAKIDWANTLPRVVNGYNIEVFTPDTNVTDVNVEVKETNGTYDKNIACTQSGTYWLCDLNTYDINAGKYILLAYAYSSGTLVGFDAKYSTGGPLKEEEFATRRDVVDYNNVIIQPDKITLEGILAGFKYRRPVEISNTSSRDYKNVAVRVILDTNLLISEGKMKSDCSDVRFTESDGATEIPYWLEPGTCDTNATVFWVKVPYVPAEGNTTIYVYYGNPDAQSASDGSAVFDFFDGFESWNGWVQYGSGVVSQDCSAGWDGSCSLLKTTNNDPNGGYKDLGFDLNYPFVLEAEVYRVDLNGGTYDQIGVIDDNGNGYGTLFDHGNQEVGVDKRTNYTATATEAAASANPYQVWYRQELIWEGNGTIIARSYDESGNLLGQASITDTSYTSFTRVYVFGGYDYRVDDIRIRPYFQNPPTATVGSEEDVPLVSTATTGNWLGGFEYRNSISVVNLAATALRDYQVKVVLDTNLLISEGKMKSDCSDVRFTESDGATEIPYWLEPGTCDTNATVFWVKVPYVPAEGNTTIYVYYGNPDAQSASDGSAVFDFFDGFESWNGWVQYGSGVVSQDCSAGWDGSCSLLKTTNNDPNGGYKDLGFDLNYPFVLEAEVYRVDLNGGTYDQIGVIDDNGNGYGIGYCHNSTTGLFIDKRADYNATIYGSVDTGADIQGQWYWMRFIWTGNGKMYAQYGPNGASTTYTDTSYTSFTRVYVFGGYDYRVDDIRIRKYVSPEPKAIVHSYEPRYAPSGYVEFNFIKPIAVALWTYLDINVANVRDTNTYVEVLNSDGNVLCGFDVTPGIVRYDISGCAGDANEIQVKIILSTKDTTVTPVVRNVTVHWIENTRIKLLRPSNQYQFRNEEMDVNGWLSPDINGCTEVNAYLYYKTVGSPKTIEEYNYDQFSTRSYDYNVYIGDYLRPAYLHPSLGYYVRTIEINNSSGVDLNDYPVKIVINTQELIENNEMRSDCGDIRVTDANYNELNYWIRPGTCDTTATEIWVQVPNIPPGISKIYLFHGNLNNTSMSNGEAVFPNKTVLSGSCEGSTAGGSCTVTLTAPSGYAFAPYQPTGYGELNMAMSGDFDYGGAYSNPTICDTGGYERAYFVFDNTWCLGTYTTGYQDCTDRTPSGWPIDVRNILGTGTTATITAQTDAQVNYDPGCGYYYHFVYSLPVYLRKYVSPEPTVSVPSTSRPDVAPISEYVSDALDTGETQPAWGTISWTGDSPPNTSVKVYVRTSSDGATWSQWYPVSNGGSIPAPRQRYIEYNVMFYTDSDATALPTFDNLKIVYYHGVPDFTLTTPTDLTLSTQDSNPFQCGAVAAGEVCEPHWATVPKDRGEYELIMKVTSDCGFEGNSNIKIVYVFAKTAIIDLATDKNVVAKGDAFTLSGKVIDELGNPVARRTVLIYDDNTYIGSTVTRDDGSFAFTYTVPTTASVGYHTITAVFPRDGEEYYWGSEASTTIKYTSKPKITNVAVSPTVAGIGDSVSISADVTDEVGLKSVTLTVTGPDTDETEDMNCVNDVCTAEFNDTWYAGEYNATITATNLDGITTTYTANFEVQGHATFGVQVAKGTYGALEDVLLWNGRYWADPLSTYSFEVNAMEAGPGKNVSLSMSIPASYDPFHSLQAYTFTRLDGSEFNATYGAGVDGNALLLSGNGGVIIPASSTIMPRHGITIGAWIREDSNAGIRTILALDDNAGNKIYALYSPAGDTNICFTLRTTAGTYSACTPEASMNTWHYVAASFDGTSMRIYVDGTLQAYKEVGEALTIDYSNAEDFITIGTEIAGSSPENGWIGAIDDVKIYPVALTDSEVRATMDGNWIPVNENGYWPFDGNAEDAHPYKEEALLVIGQNSTEENVIVLTDYIGTRNIATNNGATSVQGMEGNAAYFNGSAVITYTSGDMNLFNTFSAALWIYPEANGGTILNKGYPNSPSWKISMLSDGKIQCTLRDASGVDHNVVSTNPVPLNRWTHITCVYDRAYLRLYVNGSEEGSLWIGNFGQVVNPYELNVGSGFVGKIDDLAIYHYPINGYDVKELNAGMLVPWGLSLYQNFDTNDWDDESNDWDVRIYSGGLAPAYTEDANTGTYKNLGSAEIVSVKKRSAVCNTGDTNVSGYVYVDVQTGAGTTWTTVPPVTVNEVASGVKRTIPPHSCLDLADIYNASPWNTSTNPAGTYRVRFAFLRAGGSPGNVSDEILTSDGLRIGDSSEFNIVSATLALSNIVHSNLAEYNLNEYETTDEINWIDVYVTAKNSTAVDTNVTLSLTDAYGAYAGFGPDNETKYYGTIPENNTAVERWDNGGSGYYIPANIEPGTYEFHWLVEMNAANGPSVTDFTRFVVIHNLPSEFNSTLPTRIYYYDDKNSQVTYQFCMENPWSKEINDISVKINCPANVGLVCVGANSGTDTETLANLASGASACFDFNVIATPSSVTGDYDVNVDVTYTNPAHNTKHWAGVQNHVLEVRKTGILAVEISRYDENAIRGETNVVFISKAHNTGTATDENAWIAYTFPADWNVLSKSTNGSWGAGEVNAFESAVPPDGNIELNVTFGIPADANLGPQLVEINTFTATNPGWGDFKNVYVTVWDQPEMNESASDYNASVGETVTLYVHLTYSDGTPIPDQTIDFDKNGAPLGSAETNAGGWAEYAWNLSGESPGTYVITAKYDGNSDLYTLGADANVTVNVGLPPEVNATVNPKTTGYGLNFTIEANATDDQGIKAVWATVTKPDGNEFNVSLSNVSGDTYTGTFAPWEEGNYSVVVYAEDLYDSVTATPSITVTAEASTRMGVETDKNFYLQGEAVRLKSPGWWNTAWTYRVPITIKNQSTSDMVDYPVKITVDTNTLIQEGKLRYDLGDIRFVTADGTELNYWWQPVIKTVDIIPQASDDTDPTTKDALCSANPTYKYYACPSPCNPTGWYEPSYDDSSWLTGYAPFGGTGGQCTDALTSAPDELFVRKHFYIPGGVIDANLYVSSDDGAECYINGILVFDDITSTHDANYWNYEVNVQNVLKHGDNILACWVSNGGENNGTGVGYFDAKLRVKYYAYELPDENFWVKIPYLAAGQNTTIYMYYGNPDATSESNAENVFQKYSATLECQGEGTGCGVDFLSENNAVFAPYQNGATLDFLMSGDFDTGGAYADPTSCVQDDQNERVSVYLNGSCYGTYSTGYQDCIDREPQTWPKNVAQLIENKTDLNVNGDTFPQVNYDPGCGYYYHFVWTLSNAYIRPYVSPEPLVTEGQEETIAGSYIWPYTTFRGYLIGVIERNTAAGWEYVATDLNDLASGTERTFDANVLYDLSTVWNDWNTYGQPEGTYRAMVMIVGPDGNVLTQNGAPMEEYNIFQIGPPPVDVNISAFRVYDVNGVADPRTEGNLVDSGLEKTIYIAADKEYRIEFDVTVSPTSNDWNIADSNVWMGELNSEWNVLDVWYTLPDGTDKNGGTFDGNVYWDTNNDGTAGASQTVTFHFLVDLNTMHAEEWNADITVTHPAFIKRSDWVVLKTFVPDIYPPVAVEYNLLNVDTNQEGWEINAIRGQTVKIFAEWNEDISDAYVEYNGTSSTLTTAAITPDGNYTEYNFTTTSFWLLGPHVAKIHAADLSGNWNDDLNYLTFYIWGLANVSSLDLNDTNVYVGDSVEINCTVVDPTNSNSPIGNYPVKFWDNGTLIATAYTNSSGVASIVWTPNSFGDHVIECNTDTNSERWYTINPPNNEKNTTIFVKETIPPEWADANAPTKVHRGDVFETNVLWWDNDRIASAALYVEENGGTYQEVNAVTVDSNNVHVPISWSVPSDANLGPALWYQEANDPSGNVTDTNALDFNVWGWAYVSDSYVAPTAVAPGGEVNAYCQVKDYTAGTAIPNYVVNFEINGTSIGTAETNADGWAKITFSAPSTDGLYSVKCWIDQNAELFYDPYPDKNSATALLNVTTSSDTTPPVAVNWELNDMNRTQVNVSGDTTGVDINVIRGDDINFWAVWDENLSKAWIDTNIDATTTTSFGAAVDGNYAAGIIETNEEWARGLHYATMYALDAANNPSTDANSAKATYTVYAPVAVHWISPTGTVSQQEYNLVCYVDENDTGKAIAGYSVDFYDNSNGYLGSATTDSEGYARLEVNFANYNYGSYYFWCQISDDLKDYYKAVKTEDGATVSVAAVNLKATGIDVNVTSSSVQEGNTVLVEGNVWNQYDPVDANVAILVQKWDGSEWNTVDENLYYHSFASDENATFDYIWTAVPGRWRFVLAADPNNAVGEENELDNNAYVELNVPTWATIYGDVNGLKVLGSQTYYFYTWSGTGNGVVLFYDADVNDINVDELQPITTESELNLVDKVLGTVGNPDCILCRYDANGDGKIDSWHVFDIAGREINAPVFYVENWPVGILYDNNDGASSFDGTQPIVFVTEIYSNQSCTYSPTGVCDYVAEVPSPLKRQFGPTNKIKIEFVR